MENLAAIERQTIKSILALFQSGDTFDGLMEVHDFIIYGLDAELFTSTIQNGAWTIKQIAEAIKPLENQFNESRVKDKTNKLHFLQKAIELYPDAMDSFAEQYLAEKRESDNGQ